MAVLPGMGALSSPESTTAPLKLKVATYNIHGGIGTDGKLDLARVARVLKVGACDVIGLNEVYHYTDGTSQDEIIAAELGPGWRSVFGKTILKPGAAYGNAILTRLPIVSSEVWMLDEFPRQERRGLLRVTVSHAGELVHVFTTHMGLSGTMRQKNAAQALEIMAGYTDGKQILLGDFNEVPPARGLKLVTDAGFTDAWDTYGLTAGKTFPSRPALRRLDYIWLGPGLAAETCYVGAFKEAKIASDHRPVFAAVIKDIADEGQKRTADAPAGWTRRLDDGRKRGDGVGTGTIMTVGDHHLWRQQSSGTLTYSRGELDKAAVATLQERGALEISLRIMTVTPGDGWTLGIGPVGFTVRHGAGQLPVGELVDNSSITEAIPLSDLRVDPYTWNDYTLRIQADDVSSQPACKVVVAINGQVVSESAVRATDLLDANPLDLWLRTNGGEDACEIFADDLEIRMSKPPLDGTQWPFRSIQPKVLKRADMKKESWWNNLW